MNHGTFTSKGDCAWNHQNLGNRKTHKHWCPAFPMQIGNFRNQTFAQNRHGETANSNMQSNRTNKDRGHRQFFNGQAWLLGGIKYMCFFSPGMTAMPVEAFRVGTSTCKWISWSPQMLGSAWMSVHCFNPSNLFVDKCSMCVCIYIIYVCIYIYVCMYIYICTYVNIRVHWHIHISKCMYIYICIIYICIIYNMCVYIYA